MELKKCFYTVCELSENFANTYLVSTSTRDKLSALPSKTGEYLSFAS